MKQGSICLGDILLGENKCYSQFGKVTAIKESSGSRKGLIYKIGIDYFFADEIKHWWWKELQLLLKEKHRNTYTFKDKFEVTYKAKKYLVSSVSFVKNYRLILIDTQTKRLVEVPVYELNDNAMGKIVRQYKQECESK